MNTNADLPGILRALPIHWHGSDDNTPAGCTLVVTEVLGIGTTYLCRDGAVIGRIEGRGAQQNAYVGDGLKGGHWAGSTGTFYELAARVADHRDKENA
jgi:hypothetical protein